MCFILCFVFACFVLSLSLCLTVYSMFTPAGRDARNRYNVFDKILHNTFCIVFLYFCVPIDFHAVYMVMYNI